MKTTTIEAVAECADFGPAYDGEDYVTLTFRVHKDHGAVAGIWDLTPRSPGNFPWAVTKYPTKLRRVMRLNAPERRLLGRREWTIDFNGIRWPNATELRMGWGAVGG